MTNKTRFCNADDMEKLREELMKLDIHASCWAIGFIMGYHDIDIKFEEFQK